MIILVGSLPPPVGGVSKYCERLLAWLKRQENTEVLFLDSKELLRILLYMFWRRPKIDLVHINCSSPVLIFAYLLSARLLAGSHVAITLHSNYDRPRRLMLQFLLNLSLSLASHVLVLNRRSYKKVALLNGNTFLSSSFVPFESPRQVFFPADLTSLHFLNDRDPVRLSLASIRNQYSYIISTTAWRRTFQSGHEIYGIDQIVALAPEHKDCFFIISDPSSEYLLHFIALGLSHENVSFITEPHDFTTILLASDLFLRNTITDGDSTSVREAIFFDIPVAATSCVDRPNGCIIYAELDSLTFRSILERTRVPSTESYSNLFFPAQSILSSGNPVETSVTSWYSRFWLPTSSSF